MKRITVWRYENWLGEGPYNCEDYWTGKEAMAIAHHDSSHPSWEADELHTFVDSEYIAGCPSYKSLMQWFEGFHRDLPNGGFYPTSYRVPEDQVEMGYSGTQVAFLRGGVRGVVKL